MSTDILIGGMAACSAGFFTNPLEVAKIRMQLQGELLARGHYVVHYRNVVHAFFQIARVDGILALQKGLLPAECYQFFATGTRLGVYQRLTDLGFTKSSDGKLSLWRSCGCAAFSGILGVSVASPLYMIKTHLQSRASVSIAVGYQHHHGATMRDALKTIYRQHGLPGLWRGLTSAWVRVAVGSASQLTAFTWAKGRIAEYNAVWGHGVNACRGTWRMQPHDVATTYSFQASNARRLGSWEHALETISCLYDAKLNLLCGFGHLQKDAESVEILHGLMCEFYAAGGWLLFPADSWLNALPASVLSGLIAAFCQTPFDVVSTRLYNQGTDTNGHGLLYRGVVDCFIKMYYSEGLWGFYKGLGASVFRLGPHTVLTLVFWHRLQIAYSRLRESGNPSLKQIE